MTETDDGERSIPNSIAALTCCGLLLGGVPEATVSKKQRAAIVASVALWSLRERGDVAFSSWQHQILWWSSEELMVLAKTGRPVSPETQSPIPFWSSRFSLEQELHAFAGSIAAGRHEGPDSRVRVRDVIEEWLGKDYGNPHKELIARVIAKAESAGIYEKTNVLRGNPISRLLFGPREVSVPTLAQASVLADSCQLLVEKWHQFMRQEPDLSNSLITTVEDAIARRTVSSD
jgi:hypothetical protein